MRWDQGTSYNDLLSIARKLEAFATKANAKAMALAGIEPGRVVEAFAEAQAGILRFDAFSKKRFEEALEAARVRTIAGDNVFLGCVMCAAVALSHFKKLPRPVDGSAARRIAFLQARSTGVPALWLLSVASLSKVFGTGTVKQIEGFKKRRKQKDVMDV